MSSHHPLRGGCSCGRNKYIIEIPEGATDSAQVLFDTDSSRRNSQATPLAAFIRVPLAWYHSATFAFFPDETSSMIRRVYESPSEQHSKRHFCGFCGTPLSYWSEQPRSEADYIQLALGSLSRRDLSDLEDLGLIPDEEEAEPEASQAVVPAPKEEVYEARETSGLPWFDTMMQGSILGSLHTSKGSRQSRDGRARVEWEIVEWKADDDSENSSLGKRKLQDRDDQDGGAVQMDISRH
ncbi:hypothetical protein UCRPA7_1451 [Phaeoacremonium minimum UCRPA7]|uniref:CENP-V/GFA domain-containing protein n=1 Tax=Phaeoacremonium minimum (strain UCR-PA7) TaxID=1286976 RepID=R8BUR4_PHAM7|nr:hypothetical protein UCRPA7_1451 [Phaeoacremonium minimum UCRPA7]EOO03050.1 hypothetical protein UCRPA7_1451 [Phaeoacremonium minimum UCRPA7]